MINVGTILRKTKNWGSSEGCYVIVVEMYGEEFIYRYWDNGAYNGEHGISCKFKIEDGFIIV